MTKELERMYRRFRADPASMLVGRNAEMALRYARIMLAWEELESKGVVRLRVESDDDYRRHEYDSGKCTDDHPCAECQALDKGDGAWGTIAEYRIDPDDDDAWETADSCWGHVGYDDPASPFENCYVIDEMAEAIDAYRIAVTASLGIPVA